MRPVPPGNLTRTATVRSMAAGSRPTSRHAASTTSRSAATPSGALPMSANQLFHAWTCGAAMRSIRGPFEPIISGGPLGRGPRGSSSAVARLVEAPVEVDRAVLQQRPDDRERLLEPVDAMVERDAERPELGLVPAGAEAEDQPAAADLVDRRGLLGEDGGVVERRAGDQRPELDAAR